MAPWPVRWKERYTPGACAGHAPAPIMAKGHQNAFIFLEAEFFVQAFPPRGSPSAYSAKMKPPLVTGLPRVVMVLMVSL